MTKILNKRSIAIVLSIVLIIATLMIFASTQAQANRGLAEIYLQRHSNFDNTLFRTERRNAIVSMGYDPVGCYTNVPIGPKTSASVLRTLANDRICVIRGHGGVGRMVSNAPNGDLTRLSDRAQPENWNYSLSANFSGSQLNGVRFIHYGGCNTNGTHATFGNLATRSTTLGVQSVLTHNDFSYACRTSYYSWRIFHHANLNKTIGDSRTAARTDTLTHYGTTDSFSLQATNTTLNGSSTLRLK